jgi:RNase P/RNase MRP subunit POP5
MMREKRRYILVESTIEIGEIARRDFEFELYKELLHTIGELNYFRANPKVIKYIRGNQFVLKCSLAKYKETILALTFIKRIAGKEVGFYTIGASGTIRALQKPKGKISASISV